MKKVVFLAALIGAVSLITAGVALSAHDVPGTVTPGTISKEAANACDGGLKIEDPATGTYALNYGDFTVHLQITVVNTANGPSFTFVSTSGEVITSISVKGGPGDANFYNYGAGVEHDDGLHSPLNPKNPNNQWYGLSHLCVAADKI